MTDENPISDVEPQIKVDSFLVSRIWMLLLLVLVWPKSVRRSSFVSLRSVFTPKIPIGSYTHSWSLVLKTTSWPRVYGKAESSSLYAIFLTLKYWPKISKSGLTWGNNGS